MEQTILFIPFLSKATGAMIAHYLEYENGAYQKRVAIVLGEVKKPHMFHYGTLSTEDGAELYNIREVKAIKEMSNRKYRTNSCYRTFNTLPTINLHINEEMMTIGLGGTISLSKGDYTYTPVQILKQVATSELPSMDNLDDVKRKLNFLSRSATSLISNEFSRDIGIMMDSFGLEVEEQEEEKIYVPKDSLNM